MVRALPRQALTGAGCLLATIAFGAGWVTLVDSRSSARADDDVERTIEWVLGGDDPDTCASGYTSRLMVQRFAGDGTPYELCESTLQHAEVAVLSSRIEGSRATAVVELNYDAGVTPPTPIRVALLKQDHWRLDQIDVPKGEGAGTGAALAEVEGAPQWDAFAARADRTCWLGYSEGIEQERATDGVAREAGWGSRETEAAIRFSWADVLRREYHQMLALGSPPSRASRFERWRETILRRSHLYADVGRAWLTGRSRAVDDALAWLNTAKLQADRLAGPLPFEICGTRAPSG